MDSFDLSKINNPAPESILNSKYLDADYLFGWLTEFINFIFRQETVSFLNTLSIILSLFFITLIIYSVIRLLEIRKKEHEHTHHEVAEYRARQAEKERKKAENESTSHNPRWRNVLTYLFSINPGDWKLSVIEADSMLEALLDQLGFKGETLGDKLKSADPTKFRGLPIAWEVHTVRNRIAHEGSSFELSSHEAKRIIALYEQIFRPFGYI
jgi:hypothetical protein